MNNFVLNSTHFLSLSFSLPHLSPSLAGAPFYLVRNPFSSNELQFGSREEQREGEREGE